MRICLYTETALPKVGGQELVVDALAREYHDLGHEVTVLAPNPRWPLRANDLERSYPVERHPRFISTRLFVDWYRHWLGRLHRRKPFDVLHCHSVYPCGYLAALASTHGRVPTVITSHGGDVREHNPRFRKPGLRERHVRAVGAADALVSISDFTTDGFLRLGADPRRIVAIPNGVHTAPLRHPAERPTALDARIQPGQYLLFLGRLSRRKGVDVLLDALAAWAAQRGGRLPLDVVIAGDGTERPALETQTAAANLTAQVHFVGPVGGGVKTYLLQNAAALVVPSRDWEAFPLVLLEAYAAGCPVIGTRVPGLRSLIVPGQHGWLAEPESPAALAQTLDDALADRATLADLGRRLRDAAAGFDWTSIAARHLALYTELLSRRPAAKAA